MLLAWPTHATDLQSRSIAESADHIMRLTKENDALLAEKRQAGGEAAAKAIRALKSKEVKP